MKVRPAERHELQWIEGRAHCVLSHRAIGLAVVDVAGVIKAMVAYDGFTPNSCTVHQAADSAIAWRHLIPAVFIFPFKTLGLGVVVGVMVASNTKALRMTKRLGFKETHRVKDGWEPGEDMVVHELRRADCAHLWPLETAAEGKAA